MSFSQSKSFKKVFVKPNQTCPKLLKQTLKNAIDKFKHDENSEVKIFRKMNKNLVYFLFLFICNSNLWICGCDNEYPLNAVWALVNMFNLVRQGNNTNIYVWLYIIKFSCSYSRKAKNWIFSFLSSASHGKSFFPTKTTELGNGFSYNKINFK